MTDLEALAARPCVPTSKGGRRDLEPGELEALAATMNGWKVVEGPALRRTWPFPNFKSALAFVNKIGALAEEVGHHPELTVSWGRVDCDLWTHEVGGLTECDFVFAARCELARR